MSAGAEGGYGRRPGFRMLVGGLGLALSGLGPLGLYVLFGPADGNPIGLGLWFIVAFPAGLILAAFGAIQMLIAALVRRGG